MKFKTSGTFIEAKAYPNTSTRSDKLTHHPTLPRMVEKDFKLPSAVVRIVEKEFKLQSAVARMVEKDFKLPSAVVRIVEKEFKLLSAVARMVENICGWWLVFVVMIYTENSKCSQISRFAFFILS